MKKSLVLLISLLFTVLPLFAEENLRSGFIEGFDESKYQEVTIPQSGKIAVDAYKAGGAELRALNGMCLKTRGHISLNYYNSWMGWTQLSFYGDGDYVGCHWKGGRSFPENMPMFTTLEVYYHFEVDFIHGGYSCFLDGWKVLDDVRIEGIKYRATGNLRIRKSPTLSAPVVGRVEDNKLATVTKVGEKATIDGIESVWVQVLTEDGQKGWCFAGYLTDGTEYREKPWTNQD